MRAVFVTGSARGLDALRCDDHPVPRVRDRQVLIRVHAAGVNPRDRQLADGTYAFRHLAGRRPVVLGSDVSGEVVERGRKVVGLEVGDAVLAMQTTLGRMGGFAEYVAVDAAVVARKPASLTHTEAAALPVAGLTAWQALGRGRDLTGRSVAVLGATGGVGHLAVQIARHLGASVTAVCSGRNAELARRLGADRVIDYTRERFVEVAGRHDIVFDTVGAESLQSCRPVLRPRGRYLTTVPSLRAARAASLGAITSPVLRRPGATLVLVMPDAGQLGVLGDLATRDVVRPVIQHEYALEHAREALQEIGGGHVRGKLVLTVP